MILVARATKIVKINLSPARLSQFIRSVLSAWRDSSRVSGRSNHRAALLGKLTYQQPRKKTLDNSFAQEHNVQYHYSNGIACWKTSLTCFVLPKISMVDGDFSVDRQPKSTLTPTMTVASDCWLMTSMEKPAGWGNKTVADSKISKGMREGGRDKTIMYLGVGDEEATNI